MHLGLDALIWTPDSGGLKKKIKGKYRHFYYRSLKIIYMINFPRHTDLIKLHFGFLTRSTSDGHKHHNMF